MSRTGTTMEAARTVGPIPKTMRAGVIPGGALPCFFSTMFFRAMAVEMISAPLLNILVLPPL